MGGWETVSPTPDLRMLVDELRFVVAEYGCVAVSATFISLDGEALTLQATAGGLVTIADESGHLTALPWACDPPVEPERVRKRKRSKS